MAFALTLVLLASPGMSLEPLAKRIAHKDPSKYSREPHVHGGAAILETGPSALGGFRASVTLPYTGPSGSPA